MNFLPIFFICIINFYVIPIHHGFTVIKHPKRKIVCTKALQVKH